MGMVGATISFGTALYPAIGGFSVRWTGWPFWISWPLRGRAAAGGMPWVSAGALQRPHTGMDWKQYARDSRSIIFPSAAIGLFRADFLCFILYGPTITYFPLLADLLYKASFPYRSRLYRGFAGYGGQPCHESGVARAEIYSHRRLMLSATCCYAVAQTLMLVLPDVSSLWWLTLPIFHRRSGAGPDVPC